MVYRLPPQALGAARTVTYSIANVAVGFGTARLYNDTGAPWRLLSVRATVEVPPSGGAVVVDLLRNGTSVFSEPADRPTIPPGAVTSGKVVTIGSPVVADGDYLTLNIDVTTVPAANLTVTVTLS